MLVTGIRFANNITLGTSTTVAAGGGNYTDANGTMLSIKADTTSGVGTGAASTVAGSNQLYALNLAGRQLRGNPPQLAAAVRHVWSRV